jgi:hypothetical protein
MTKFDNDTRELTLNELNEVCGGEKSTGVAADKNGNRITCTTNSVTFAGITWGTMDCGNGPVTFVC